MTLIDDINQAKDNITKFNNILKDDVNLIEILSNFRHWYYDSESDFFAPSKFIGYKDNNSEKYFGRIVSENPVRYTDGRDTQEALKKFYKQVDDDLLFDKLESMLNLCNKKPNKRAVIYIQK